MERNDYGVLSYTFESCFPQIFDIMEETEEFYLNNVYNTEDMWKYCSKPDVHLSPDIKQELYLGKLTINNKDTDRVLPRLYLYKERNADSKHNPDFYLITTPNDEPLYIGTSHDTIKQKSCSLSALTGGVCAYTESKDVYNAYLGLLVAIKKYDYCNVYGIPGYGLFSMINASGKFMPEKDLITADLNERVYRFLKDDELWVLSKTHNFNPDIFKKGGMYEEQGVRNDKIWSTITTFKGMIKNGVMTKLDYRCTIEDKPLNFFEGIGITNPTQIDNNIFISGSVLFWFGEYLSNTMKALSEVLYTLNHMRQSGRPVPGTFIMIDVSAIDHSMYFFKTSWFGDFVNSNKFFFFGDYDDLTRLPDFDSFTPYLNLHFRLSKTDKLNEIYDEYIAPCCFDYFKVTIDERNAKNWADYCKEIKPDFLQDSCALKEFTEPTILRDYIEPYTGDKSELLKYLL